MIFPFNPLSLVWVDGPAAIFDEAEGVLGEDQLPIMGPCDLPAFQWDAMFSDILAAIAHVALSNLGVMLRVHFYFS